jgi:hypothetical protein
MKALVGHKLSYTVYYIRDGFTGVVRGGSGVVPWPEGVQGGVLFFMIKQKRQSEIQ